MAAYGVVHLTRTDPECAARYSAMSGPSVERHGGRFLARGGEIRVLEPAASFALDAYDWQKPRARSASLGALDSVDSQRVDETH